MSETTPTSVQSMADDLFDKYLLPKAALTVILVASFVGTAVTIRLTDGWRLAFAVTKWAYLVSLGTLTGGLVWKHGFVRPGDVSESADGYCERMYDRFDRIAAVALVVFAASATAVFYRYATTGLSTAFVGGVVGVTGVAALTATETLRSHDPTAQFRGPLGLAALGAATLAVAATAVLDVSLAGGGPLAVGVRVLHLLAFSVWVGGAVWNIFVAVPSGQTTPTTPVIRAAGQQLERFRWAVRLIIPTLLVTGLYQAVDALGVEPDAYVGSLVGLAVLAKLGFVVVLIGIFITCPMWRACSPIDGVCDLEDLSADSGGPTRGVTDDD